MVARVSLLLVLFAVSAFGAGCEVVDNAAETARKEVEKAVGITPENIEKQVMEATGVKVPLRSVDCPISAAELDSDARRIKVTCTAELKSGEKVEIPITYSPDEGVTVDLPDSLKQKLP